MSMPSSFSNASRFSALRGKPSMRNFVFPDSSIAFLSSPMVTLLGTIFPSAIIALTMFPSSVPDLTCARSRSPAERCTTPNSSTSLAHCVPFPLPGPPSTNTTWKVGAAHSMPGIWLMVLRTLLSTDSGVVPLDESADAEDVGAAKAHVAANPAERSPSETVRLEAVWVEDPAAEAATAAVAYDRSAGAYAAAAADAGHLRSSVESRGVRLRDADMA
mmetsp:Transcript_8623/g.23068  ORF Transcript_8623/g.23068 Transcript_8623/m.23068 type:complete len:217 (-) Transcript_8623:31-681(-)